MPLVCLDTRQLQALPLDQQDSQSVQERSYFFYLDYTHAACNVGLVGEYKETGARQSLIRG